MPERQLNWDITGRCNLFCAHCYAYDKYEWRNPLRVIREDLPFQKACSLLTKAKAMGFQHVHLLGGEPLLRKDLLEILTFARSQLGLRITMNTNGLLLTPTLIERLIDLEIFQVAISFEGTTAAIHDQIRGHGNFEKARQNLRALGSRVRERGSDMLVGVGYVLTRGALADVQHAFQFALDNAANGLTIDVVTDDGRAREIFDRLSYSDADFVTALESLMASAAGRVPPDFVFQINVKPKVRRYLSERYGMRLIGEAFGDMCPAGEYTMLVENDGVVTPCGILNKKTKNHLAVAAGEYRSERLHIDAFESLEQLQGSAFYQTFMDFKRRHQGTVPTCQTCEFRETCQPCPVDYLDSPSVGQCVESEERRLQWRAQVSTLPLSVTRDRPARLNATAARIVDRLRKGRSLNQITRELAAGSDATAEEIVEHVWEFAIQLRQAGWLDLPSQGSPSRDEATQKEAL